MDLTTVVSAIVEKGGIAGVAFLALYMLNSVWSLVLAREKTYAAEIARINDLLLKTVSDHTAETIRLTTVIENFLHGTERDNRAKSQT